MEKTAEASSSVGPELSVFDLKSAGVLAAATVSAIGVGLWLNHADGRGQAGAAEPASIVEAAVAATPGPEAASSPRRAGAYQVMRSHDGHYWAEAVIDRRAVRLLVDTGASVVALTREDARRLGLDLKPQDFSSTVNTASGPGRAARLTLASVSIGGTRVERVEAMVVEKGLTQSLLGMSYLGRLSGFEATPQGLTLRP